ncbi:MAG TPA: RHS repeat-associated core domain-containing protein [Candidatus Binatia bacterium]|nr:RHS repeat-associated core domain-containing protein [Candidatus Binatia bacterium]
MKSCLRLLFLVLALVLVKAAPALAGQRNAAVLFAGDYPGGAVFDDHLSLSSFRFAQALLTWPNWQPGPNARITLLPGNASPQQFIAAITDFAAGGANELQAGDFILVLYFGHGGYFGLGDPTAERYLSFPPVYLWWPVFPFYYVPVAVQQGITDNQLAAVFNSFKPGVMKAFINISCYSGGFWGVDPSLAGDLALVPNMLLMASSIETLPTMTGNLPPYYWEPTYLHNLINNLYRNGRRSLTLAQWHFASFVPGIVTGFRFDEPADPNFYALQVTADQEEMLYTDSPQCMDCPVAGEAMNLSISFDPTNNTVTVSWPSEYLGAQLQQANALLLTGSAWTNVANSTATNSLVLPVAGVARFFRLFQPGGAPDLVLTMAGTPNPVTVAGTLTYSLTVSNAGNAGATNVVLVDTLPDNLRLVSSTSLQGTLSNGVSSVDWELGILGPGQSASASIVVQPTTSGTVSNSAVVMSDTAESNWNNNRSTVFNNVTGTATQYSINIAAGPNGTVTPLGTVTKNAGQTLFLESSPATGYYVDTWYVDGLPQQVGGSTFALYNIQAAHNVMVTFRVGDYYLGLQYLIDSSAGPNGTNSPAGTFPVSPGANQTFNASPAAGYVVDRWYSNGTPVQVGGSSFALANIQAPASVLVTFTNGVANTNAASSIIGAEPPPPASTLQASDAGTAISLTEGNLLEQYSGPVLRSAFGPTIDFRLTYNSYNADGSRAQLDTMVGYGWTHSYNIFLFGQGTNMFRFDGIGRVTKYLRQMDGITYLPTPGYFETLVNTGPGQFTLTTKEKTVFIFNTNSATPFMVGNGIYRLTQITDRNQNTTTLTYSAGKLTAITDTYGRSLVLGNDAFGHLTTITDPLGRVTALQYTNNDTQLITITDPETNSVLYGYNLFHQLEAKIDKNGHLFVFSYQNREPVSIADEKGQPLFFLSNPSLGYVNPVALSNDFFRVYTPSTTVKTDGRGNPWNYSYDANGYMTSVSAPDGATAGYSYDGATLMVSSTTDANNHVTRYQYDLLGNRTNVTDALSNVTSYAYETMFSQMTNMVDPNGRTNIYQYDSRGNRTNFTDAIGQTVSYTYDGHGNVKTMRDKRGYTTSYNYDSTGNRAYITDALNNTTTMINDLVGNLGQRVDANNHTNTYLYDGLDRLKVETDPLGASTTTTYDGLGNRTTVTDRNGNPTFYTYDHRQRLTSTTDALSQTISYAYDGNNNRTNAVDRDGHQTAYAYDAQNRLTLLKDALGHTNFTAYDPAGNSLTNINPRGFPTVYQYDALNRRTTRTDPVMNSLLLPAVTAFQYAPAGGASCCSPTIGSSLLTKQTDAEGKVIYYKYDALDRLTIEVRKVGDTSDVISGSDAVTYYAYDPNDNRTSVTNTIGNVTLYQYDPLNRQTNTINAAGDVASTTYDGVGNVIAATAPNGNTSTNTYDARDRLTRIADKIGLVASYTYDPVGNCLTRIDGNTNTTTSVYDALYRLKTSTDPLSKTSIYQYDAVGNLTSTVDRNGNSNAYVYDAINRRTNTIDSLRHTNTTVFDAANNVQAVTDANGNSTFYAYDGLNRRTAETYPDGHPPRTFTYDGVGNILTRSSQDGVITLYNYDDLYRLTNRAYSNGDPSDQSTYDLAGRMLTAGKTNWLTGTNWLLTFAYDGADRLTNTAQNAQTISYAYNIPARTRTLTYPGGRAITETTDFRGRLSRIDDSGSATPIAQYTYDQADRVLTRACSSGAISTYAYNGNDWITNLVHVAFSTNLIAAFGYAYDNEGNRLSESNLAFPANSERYLYDPVYRLTNYVRGLCTNSYSLDPEGNWNSATICGVTTPRTHNAANEILSIGTNNLLYDAKGNLQDDKTYAYLYDAENRLTLVSNELTMTILGEYSYDALGRRVIKLAASQIPTVQRRYYYDGPRIIEEQDAGGGTQATYAFGGGIDEVLSMTRNETTNYFYQNALGSTVAATSNNTAVVSERYSYDAYGLAHITDATGATERTNAWGTPHSGILNTYLFTGRQLDEEDGLYYYRARFFDPGKGRFLARDPLGYVDGLNLYEYAGGGPTKRMDPFGLDYEIPGPEQAGKEGATKVWKVKDFAEFMDKKNPLNVVDSASVTKLPEAVQKQFKGKEYGKMSSEYVDGYRLGLGCVGLTSIYQMSAADWAASGQPWPEGAKDVECFPTLDGAKAKTCGKGQELFIFEKQGEFLARRDEKGEIAKNKKGEVLERIKLDKGKLWYESAGNKPVELTRQEDIKASILMDHRNKYNYVIYFYRGKNQTCAWMNLNSDTARAKEVDQEVSVGANPPAFAAYPDSIFCSQCRPKK